EDEGRDEAQEEIGRQRPLPAIARLRQRGYRTLVGEELLQREALDDVAHVFAAGDAADAALVGTAAAAQARHLLGAHLFALQRDALDARLHLRAAAKEGGAEREDHGRGRDRGKDRDQEVRVGEGSDEVVHHARLLDRKY